MSTIDTSGNIHKGAGAPGGGQFAGKVNTAPAATLDAGTTAPRSESADLIVVFDQQRQAIWDAKRALRGPAVAATTALLREKYPQVGSVHLNIESDEFEEYLALESVVERDGNYVELAPEDEEQVLEMLRAIASDRDELNQMPGVYQVPGTSTVALPIPVVEPGDYTAAEIAFDAAVAEDRYDPQLASAAIRSAGTRLYPGAEALVFHMNYTDEGACLSLATVQGGDFDGGDETDLPGFDDIDQIAFSMSGGGDTGDQIPGMRETAPGSDRYIFDLKG